MDDNLTYHLPNFNAVTEEWMFFVMGHSFTLLQPTVLEALH